MPELKQDFRSSTEIRTRAVWVKEDVDVLAAIEDLIVVMDFIRPNTNRSIGGDTDLKGQSATLLVVQSSWKRRANITSIHLSLPLHAYAETFFT